MVALWRWVWGADSVDEDHGEQYEGRVRAEGIAGRKNYSVWETECKFLSESSKFFFLHPDKILFMNTSIHVLCKGYKLKTVKCLRDRTDQLQNWFNLWLHCFKLRHIYITIEIWSTHRSKFQCLYTYARISKKNKSCLWYFRLYKKRLQVNRKHLILWLSVLRPCFSQLRTTEWPHSLLSSAHAIQASLLLQRSVSRT